MVITATQLVVFPQASVEVKVTFTDPSQSAGNCPLKSLVILTSPHTSVPSADNNQAFINWSLPMAPHSKLKLDGQVIIGAVVSSIVKFPTPVVSLPQSSVTVNMNVCLSEVPQPEVVLFKMTSVVISPHSSVPETVANHVSSAAVFPAPSHSTVVSAGVLISGAVVSSKTTEEMAVEIFPQSSVIVHRCGVLVASPQITIASNSSTVQLTSPQSSSATPFPLRLNQLL